MIELAIACKLGVCRTLLVNSSKRHNQLPALGLSCYPVSCHLVGRFQSCYKGITMKGVSVFTMLLSITTPALHWVLQELLSTEQFLRNMKTDKYKWKEKLKDLLKQPKISNSHYCHHCAPLGSLTKSSL